MEFTCEICNKHFKDSDSEGHFDESGDYCIPCHDKWLVQGALDAGIPLSVIEGKTKLTDHFSEDYINFKCNRGDK